MFQCVIPKRMQPTIARTIQAATEASGTELSPDTIWSVFDSEFINRCDRLSLTNIQTELFKNGEVTTNIDIQYNDQHSSSSFIILSSSSLSSSSSSSLSSSSAMFCLLQNPLVWQPQDSEHGNFGLMQEKA